MNLFGTHGASAREAPKLFWITRAAVLATAAGLAAGLTGCGSSAPRFRTGEVTVPSVERPRTTRPERNYTNRTPEGVNRDRMLLEMVGFLGVPYEYGGTSRNGIDCSGFTQRVYQEVLRLKLPRSTSEQFRTGKPVGQEDLMFGDLVFFNTTGAVPSHVGIYIEDDVFAHASVTNGVTFGSMESEYYRDRFVGARRLVR